MGLAFLFHCASREVVGRNTKSATSSDHRVARSEHRFREAMALGRVRELRTLCLTGVKRRNLSFQLDHSSSSTRAMSLRFLS
jgi:hypothetical protein